MPLRPTHPDGTPFNSASEFVRAAQDIADLYPDIEGSAQDLGEAAAAGITVEAVTEETAEVETREQQYLRELQEDRADRQRDVGWRLPDDAPVRRPDLRASGSPRPSRHITRTGPRRPRDSRGMSEFVPTRREAEYTARDPEADAQNLAQARQARATLQQQRERRASQQTGEEAQPQQ